MGATITEIESRRICKTTRNERLKQTKNVKRITDAVTVDIR